MTTAGRRQHIESSHPSLSVSRQCSIFGLNRSSVYYRPQPATEGDLRLMRLIDAQYLETPFYGSRSMTYHLRRLGHEVNRKRVRRLMRLMGIEAIYPKPKTSRPHPQHRIYPYLLRDMAVRRPNQVWASDITYVPMMKGFMYLTAVMDWHSRKVMAFRISNTMDSEFCVAAVEEAISRYGAPEIFNTDQGSQFTSRAFAECLESRGVRISMDGRGRFHDNIFIERLWWTVKHQYLYLREFESGGNLRRGLAEWFDFYNRVRPHQTFDGQTPDEVYIKELAAA